MKYFIFIIIFYIYIDFTSPELSYLDGVFRVTAKVAQWSKVVEASFEELCRRTSSSNTYICPLGPKSDKECLTRQERENSSTTIWSGLWLGSPILLFQILVSFLDFLDAV